ncbi:MAG: tape measure protein [Pseudomonadota bacterium]
MSAAFRATARAAAAVGAAIAAVGLAAGGREFVQLADSARQVENRLRLVTESSEELRRVQSELFDVAQRTRTSFEGQAELYSRVALASSELGVSQREIIAFSEGVGNALAITGTSATAASGSLLQLSQAIGGGIVRAEEFNSILEGTPRIAQAVADGLDEAGGSVARLRNLVIEGEVSSREFFDAFSSQLPVLQEEFARTETTVGGALTQVQNALLRSVGAINEATGTTSALAAAFTDLAEVLSSDEFITVATGAVNALGVALQGVISVVGALVDLGRAIGREFTKLPPIFDDTSNATGRLRREQSSLDTTVRNVGRALGDLDKGLAANQRVLDNTRAETIQLKNAYGDLAATVAASAEALRLNQRVIDAGRRSATLLNNATIEQIELDRELNDLAATRGRLAKAEEANNARRARSLRAQISELETDTELRRENIEVWRAQSEVITISQFDLIAAAEAAAKATREAVVVTTEYGGASRATSEALKEQAKAEKELREEQERLSAAERRRSQELERTIRDAEEAARNASQAIASDFSNAFASSLSSADDFADGLLGIFESLSGGISQALAPISSTISDVLNFEVIEGLTLPAGFQGPVRASTTVGDIAGGAGLGVGIGSLIGGGDLSSQVGGGVLGGVGTFVGGLSGVGTAIGSTAASLLGPIGGVLGSLLGGLFGGIFGGPAPNNAAGTVIDPFTGQILSQGGPKSPSSENIAASGDLGSASAATFQALLRATGLDRDSLGVASDFAIAGDVSDRDGSRLRFTGIDDGARFDFDSVDSQGEIAAATVRAFVELAEGLSDEALDVFGQVLGGLPNEIQRGSGASDLLVDSGEIDVRQLERATEVLAILTSTAEALGETEAPLGPLAQSLQLIQDNLAASTQALQEFGLSTADVEEVARRATADLISNTEAADAAARRAAEGFGSADAAAAALDAFSAGLADREAIGAATDDFAQTFRLNFANSLNQLSFDELTFIEDNLAGLATTSDQTALALELVDDALQGSIAAAGAAADATGVLANGLNLVGDALLDLQARVSEVLQDFDFQVTDRLGGTAEGRDARLDALGFEGLSLQGIRSAESIEDAQAALLEFQGVLADLGTSASAEGADRQIQQAGALALAAYDDQFARLTETVEDSLGGVTSGIADDAAAATSEFESLFASISASITSSAADIAAEIQRSTDETVRAIGRAFEGQISDLTSLADGFGRAAAQAGGILTSLSTTGTNPETAFNTLLGQFDQFAAGARSGSASGVSAFSSFQGDFLNAVRNFFPEGTAEFDEQLNAVRAVAEEAQAAALGNQDSAEAQIARLREEQEAQIQRLEDASTRQIAALEQASARQVQELNTVEARILELLIQDGRIGSTLSDQLTTANANDEELKELIRRLIAESQETNDLLPRLRSA